MIVLFNDRPGTVGFVVCLPVNVFRCKFLNECAINGGFVSFGFLKGLISLPGLFK